MGRFLLSIVALSCACVSPRTPASVAPASALDVLRDAALASRGAAELARSLTDEVGARLAGSPGDRAAVEWGVRTMRAIGLENVRAEPVRAPHWERGVETGALVGPVTQPLALTALGGSPATPPGGLEAEVILARSLAEIDALDAAGKIVFLDMPIPRARDGAGYGQGVPARSEGWMHATRRGAVGIVIRSVGTDHDRLPHTGNMRQDAALRPVPAAALSNPDADLLARAIGRGAVRMKLTLGCRWLEEASSANVVGDLRGSARPDEVVLLGAHLDSWDLGTGALDDAAGVGVVLETARLIRALPRASRTLRIVLFANEENGLAGARAYAAAHDAELPRHVLSAECDMGTGRVFRARFAGAPEHRSAFRELAAPLAPLGIAVEDEPGEGGADLIPLRAAGVPAVALGQDATTYFDIHHTANDTFDKIDAEALAQVSAAFALTAHGALHAPRDFGRAPPSPRR